MQDQSTNTKTLKSLLCQILPFYKDKKQTISRVSKSLSIYTAKSQIDLVLFPELSFTGYNFKDPKDAEPLACQNCEGQEFEACKGFAIKLQAFVIFGYIEKQTKNGITTLYNSAAVINREGKAIHNYRKSHLYFCDDLWSKQGHGFETFELTNRQGQEFKASICICMDINPKHFTSGKFQYGDFIKDNKVEVVLFVTNWTDHEHQTQNQGASINGMMNYWMHRLRPAIGQGKQSQQILFLAADRVGKQYSFYDKKDVHFFGASCGIKINPTYLIKNLGKKNQGYLIIDTSFRQ